MADTTENTQVPWWYWIIAGLVILLFAAGLAQLYRLFTIDDLPDPLWAKLGYGLGQVAGFIGGVGLLLRKRWAFALFGVSFLGFLSHRIWLFFLSDLMDTLPPIAPVMLSMVLVITMLLVVWSLHGRKKGWLR